MLTSLPACTSKNYNTSSFEIFSLISLCWEFPFRGVFLYNNKQHRAIYSSVPYQPSPSRHKRCLTQRAENRLWVFNTAACASNGYDYNYISIVYCYSSCVTSKSARPHPRLLSPAASGTAAGAPAALVVDIVAQPLDPALSPVPAIPSPPNPVCNPPWKPLPMTCRDRNPPVEGEE